MYSIEEFAIVCSTSTKDILNLIHEGYFKRVSTRFNNDHVEQYRLIKRMQDFGLSYGDVEMVLKNQIAIDDMLKLRVCEIENNIEYQYKMIHKIKEKRTEIKRGEPFLGTVHVSNPYILKKPSVWVCSVRQRIDLLAINYLLRRLHDKMKAFNLRPSGNMLRILHDEIPDYKNADVEIAFPVITDGYTDYSLLRELEPGRFACIDIEGEYDEIGIGYGSLFEWIHNEKLEYKNPWIAEFKKGMSENDDKSPMIQLDIAKEPIRFDVVLKVELEGNED